MEQLSLLLKAFPSLKRLDIDLKNKTDIRNNQRFSFELFKGFPKQLTHLTLSFGKKSILFRFKKDLVLNEKFLKDFDIYFPKLQYLEISRRFKTHSRGVTQMADILSRLSSLQTIKLRFNPEVDYQPIEDMIIEKCLKIKTIEFIK